MTDSAQPVSESLIREVLQTQRGFQEEARSISQSLHNIDIKVERMGERVDFIASNQTLLQDVQPRLKVVESRLDEQQRDLASLLPLTGNVQTLMNSQQFQAGNEQKRQWLIGIIILGGTTLLAGIASAVLFVLAHLHWQ